MTTGSSSSPKIDESGTAVGLLRVPAPDRGGDDSPVDLYWTKRRAGVDDGDSDTGRPLLLICGLGSPLVSYEDGFVDELVDRGFSVVRFDNRDVGRSSRIDDIRGGDGPPYTVADMAVDAVAVLDAVGWAKAHVLGQSMGGMIAQQLAIDHQDRVASLLSLMSTTGERRYGRPTGEAHAALIKPAPSDPDEWLEYRLATERIWATPDSWDPDWVRAKGRALLDHGIDAAGTGRQFRAILGSGSRDAALSRLTTPTLVLHGSADTLIHPDGGRHTADVIPGARYLELEGMGHDLPPSRWTEMADAVFEFLADLAP